VSFQAMVHSSTAAGPGDPAGSGPSRAWRSFIGVDGTNTTMNNGRIQINLKPIEARRLRCRRGDVIRRLEPAVAKVSGIALVHAARAGPQRRGSDQPHAVPVQRGGCETRRSSRSGFPRLITKMQGDGRSCVMSPATNRTKACQSMVTIDRDFRVAAGHHPGDDRQHGCTTRFGQRQVSTIFTQQNQYHVVLEGRPALPSRRPGALKEIFVNAGGVRRGEAAAACSATAAAGTVNGTATLSGVSSSQGHGSTARDLHGRSCSRARRSRSTNQGQFSRRHVVVQFWPRARHSATR